MTSRGNRLLSIENVSVTLGGNVILRDVNAHVDDLIRDDTNSPTGQIIAFLGPSGCGKTTLLQVLAGLLSPTSGGVYLGAERKPVEAGMVGKVAQQYIVFRHHTVMGNVKIAAGQAVDNPSAGIILKRAQETLEWFGLGDKGSLYPAQLSGGQRQRLAIARQILCSDHYLLLDEPTTGLDPVSKKRVMQTIVNVANRDELSTVIMVTHDISSAVAVADTIWLMGHQEGQPGATIVDTYDLVSRGICWHDNITAMPEYHQLVVEIQNRFETL